MQSGLSKTILANDPSPPSAFASPPVANFAMSGQTAVQSSDTTNNRTGLLSASKAPYNSTEIKEDMVLGSVAIRDINGKTHSSLNMDAISKLASPTNVSSPEILFYGFYLDLFLIPHVDFWNLFGLCVLEINLPFIAHKMDNSGS